MTLESFTEGMAIFLATFGNVKATQETQKIWRRLLIDVSDNDFIYAVEKICREVRSFYPTDNFVALIREQLTVNIDERALFAWEAVLKAMWHIGSYRSVEFDDPAIHSTILIMAGGWPEFCQIRCDKWMQKEFINNYKVMVKKTSHPEYLPGIVDTENRANGYLDHVGTPKLIDTGIKKSGQGIENKNPHKEMLNKANEIILEHV